MAATKPYNQVHYSLDVVMTRPERVHLHPQIESTLPLLLGFFCLDVLSYISSPTSSHVFCTVKLIMLKRKDNPLLNGLCPRSKLPRLPCSARLNPYYAKCFKAYNGRFYAPDALRRTVLWARCKSWMLSVRARHCGLMHKWFQLLRAVHWYKQKRVDAWSKLVWLYMYTRRVGLVTVTLVKHNKSWQRWLTNVRTRVQQKYVCKGCGQGRLELTCVGQRQDACTCSSCENWSGCGVDYRYTAIYEWICAVCGCLQDVHHRPCGSHHASADWQMYQRLHNSVTFHLAVSLCRF